MMAFCLQTVKAGTAEDWSTTSPAGAGLSRDRLESMAQAVRAGNFKRVTSILVARSSVLAYETYFDGDGEAALRDTRSATDTITGMLVGIGIAKNLVPTVKAPILPLFPDKRPVKNDNPTKETLSIEDLLTMKSPLVCSGVDSVKAAKDWERYALDLPVRAPKPGGFVYCDEAVVELSAALQRMTRLSVESLAEHDLFSPLGIARFAWPSTPQHAAIFNGLALRSRDLLKLGQLYLNGGTWNGRRVIAESWVKESTEARVRIDAESQFGYLWWLRTLHAGGKSYHAWLMQGTGGNRVAVFPELKMVVVVTTTNFTAPDADLLSNRLLTGFILQSLT